MEPIKGLGWSINDNQGFTYAAEKLLAAKGKIERHPDASDDAVWYVLYECWHGLKEIRPDELDRDARTWFDELDELRGGNTPPDTDRVAAMTQQERRKVYRLVLNLEGWFQRQS